MTIAANALVDLYDPSFRKIFNDNVQKVDPVFDKVFDVLTSKQQYEKISGVTGTGLLKEKTEGQGASELKIFQKYDKTFTHKNYSGYTRVTEEASDDDLSGNLKKIPMFLGISARQTIETLAASYFDLSQTTLGPDGKVMLATDHPRADGGTWSNRPDTNADLSVSSLEAGLTGMRATVDDYGNPQPIYPTILLIPGANEFQSIQLLENADKAGTTNRDINAIKKRGLSTIIWDFLTDTDSWYLLNDPSERQLLFFMRKAIHSKMVAAPDTTGDAIFQAGFRCSYGHGDARGIYGSVGI